MVKVCENNTGLHLRESAPIMSRVKRSLALHKT